MARVNWNRCNPGLAWTEGGLMRTFIDALRRLLLRSDGFRGPGSWLLGAGSAVFLLALVSPAAFAQSPAPQPETQPAAPAPDGPPANQAASAAATDTQTPATSAATHETAGKNPTLTAGAFSIQTTGGEINEDQLRQLLDGKSLYLRGGYLDNNLEFDEQGRLTGHSPQGSFTLSQVQINKVRLSKHKLELEGDRYALHFLGAAPYEDPTKATDRVKITPKKKTVRISFDREQVETPKKQKDKHKRKQKDHNLQAANANPENQPSSNTPADSSAAAAAPAADAGGADHPSRNQKETFTTSPAHASQLLLTALDKVFSQGIDDRMIAAMPDFWKLYYQAAAARTDVKPVSTDIFSDSNVDQKAKLVSVLDPGSNEFAQNNGIAGIAMYHAIVGADGKVQAVVAGRPIGFGLDENAEQSIRKATFQPAMKDGKPVPVALDLVVSFRIYSKRTSALAPQTPDQPQKKAALPGPYTLQADEAEHASSQNQGAQPPQSAPAPQ